ncbi:MAG: amino acid carrier protein [Victivallaceae bacterium]
MFGFLVNFNDILTFYVLFPMLLILGGILTWKFRGMQFRGLGASCRFLTTGAMHSSGQDHEISRYESITAVLAGNLGTGNIAGIAVALTTGGPGALVWMWVAAFFGGIVQFAGSYLGCKYRYLKKEQYIGGPIGCLFNALNSRKLACLFCFFTITTAFLAGNMMQMNCIVLSAVDIIDTNAKISIFILGLFIMVPVWMVLIKGGNGIARFSSRIVPFIAIIYLSGCCYVIIKHIDQLLPVLRYVFSSVFGVKAGVSGVAGYTLSRVLSTGMNRAILATDCGSGVVSLLQSNSNTKNPVIDGLVTLFPPMVVMTVCTVTGLALLVSGAYPHSGALSASMVRWAFVKAAGPCIGSLSVFSVMILFGYTTILAWFSCAEKSLSFLSDNIFWHKCLKILYIGIVPFGGFLGTKFIWVLSDLSFIGMVTLNLYAVLRLLKDVFELKHPLAELSPVDSTAVID